MNTAPASSDLAAALTARLDGWAREQDLSGAFLVTQGGATWFEHCCGLADRASGTPVTPATRFGLASLTKMFTAVAIADLVSSGDVEFSTSVVDVLPPGLRPRALHPEVTVHHLLCHTSGIADYCEEDETSPAHVADYGSLWVERPSYSMLRPEDFLPLFADLAAYRPPGVRTQYSNAGYILLGLVIEQVTGRDYVEVVQERVLDRAGMAASGFFRLDEAVPHVAVGYLPRDGADAPWRSNIYSVPVLGGPDGGAFSTARDIDRFLQAYADGSLLGDLRDVLLTRHAESDDGFAEGYGVHLYPDGRYGHGGGDPGVSVLANRWPDEALNIVVLCNGEEGAGEVRDLLREAWLGEQSGGI